jgi:dTDP-D-glucose 4,6-dehydratase
LLGWAPKTELAEGLNQTIEYFENLLSDGTVRASFGGAGDLALGEAE